MTHCRPLYAIKSILEPDGMLGLVVHYMANNVLNLAT
jgi:hypothetical protein